LAQKQKIAKKWLAKNVAKKKTKKIEIFKIKKIKFDKKMARQKK